MPTYRAYLLNPAGKITWGEWIEAADQADAEAKAAELCDAGTPTVELWRGPELLAELDCAQDHRSPLRGSADLGGPSRRKQSS